MSIIEKIDIPVAIKLSDIEDLSRVIEWLKQNADKDSYHFPWPYTGYVIVFGKDDLATAFSLAFQCKKLFSTIDEKIKAAEDEDG